MKFEVNGIQRPVPRHLQRYAALVASQDGRYSSSFAKGADVCWPRAQIGDKGVRMPIWTGVPVGNLSHSQFWEVQLEGPSGDDFQVPGEGAIEVWEQGGLGLNDVP